MGCFIAIDLKSFYASVECVDRGLDPLAARLVVADRDRTDKTICLAVTPALKAYGISGRPRLFEVEQRIRELKRCNPALELDYIAAPPRMARYVEVSTQIYRIYLRYIAPEDIHIYSIDEVFIDASQYLSLYKMTAWELTTKLIKEVLKETGITATAGIGTNLYLCKVAMDISAKHIPADKYGVRIAELDEMSYRYSLWEHKPITDFWRVGHGTAKSLEAHGMYTMGDVALCSVRNEDLLYRLFGIQAELLIDHAWGWEPCTMEQIKNYRPQMHSLSSGQVLQRPYPFGQARLVAKEMAELLSLEMVDKRVVCDQLVLHVGYDIENIKKGFDGETKTDRYGRTAPKSAHGSENLGRFTSSTGIFEKAVTKIFDSIVNPGLSVRRINLTASHVINEKDIPEHQTARQLDLFTDIEAEEKRQEEEAKVLAKERRMQETILSIKKKYGKNAILKGMNFEEGATAKERNGRIGGHRK